ncbi:MAG: DUF6125 family protein [Candidatus Thorarchaeota archaeon]
MTLFEALSKSELKELLVKCWMSHDGAWFYNVLKEHGIEEANKLNKRAIKNLSLLEMKRIQKALGLESQKITTFEQLKQFIIDGFSVLKGDFMKFNYSFPERNTIHWEMNNCFAFEGMKMIGLKHGYECGVVYRVCSWLDALGVNYELKPKADKCLLYSQQKCEGDILVKFD